MFEPGAGSELFVLNVKGKILCFGYVLVDAEHFILLIPEGHSDNLITHLDRYIIREDVSLSKSSSPVRLFRPSDSDSQFSDSSGYLDYLPVSSDVPFAVVNSGLTAEQDLVALIGDEDLARAEDWFQSREISNAPAEVFELARIQQGTPIFGRDITEENLPQEIQRDELAISFTKGCYLGQETVARIDALGRVNKFLVSVNIEGQELPDVGSELFDDDDSSIGKLTSVAISPRTETDLSIVGLAIVKRKFAAPGTVLTCQFDNKAARITVLNRS